MSKYLVTVSLVLLGMVALIRGQSPADKSTVERVHCGLISEASETFSGNSHDFMIVLPEHIILRGGSEVNLALRSSAEAWPALAGIIISVNGRKLTPRLDAQASAKPTDPAIRLRAAVPEGILTAGWNQISLQLNFEAGRDPARQPIWQVQRQECFLELAFERMPLFSELVRFPASVAEEKLLQAKSEKAPSATVAVLFPRKTRDVHLRACVILGARFGQVGYLSEDNCRLGSIQNAAKECGQRNGVIIGRVDELADLAMLKSCCAQTFAGLIPGQGMLVELILGSFPRQQRWIIATGADDSGLEKAILTLGSAPALAALAPSPALIETEPAAPSKLETGETAPTKVTGLNQVSQLLTREPFLRKGAFLVPANPSVDELQMLFDLAFGQGKQRPSSPMIGLEACGYSPNGLVPATRVEHRSILLLGSVAQWGNALPSSTRLAIEVPPNETNTVLMQGRRNQISMFEPTLLLMQLLPSPWSTDETLVTAGGWTGFASSALKKMLTEAPVEGKFFGNLGALDASGRTAAYDSRRASAEPFSEHLQRKIPLGLSVADTNRRLKWEELRSQKAAHANNLVLYWAGGVLLLAIVVRLYLLWDRERRRKQSIREESSVASAP